jgi:hypothetical protein
VESGPIAQGNMGCTIVTERVQLLRSQVTS